MIRADVAQLAKSRTSMGDPPALVLASIEHGRVDCRFDGLLARSHSEAPGIDTRFEIGSITKVFVAIVLAELVQRNVLSLDDPAQAFLPGVRIPTRGSLQIRLIDLATHTAGLPAMPDAFDRARPWESFRDVSLDDVLSQVERTSLAWDIGTSYLYSNVGYALLGHILENVTGRTWDALVEEVVLGPIGMTQTGCSSNTGATAPSHFGGHRVPLVEFGALAPAGALRSTARDLLRFVQAVLGLEGSGLAPLLARTMRAHFGATTPSQMGLGWHIQLRRGKRVVWHRGETLGQTSFIAVLPDEARAVIMLSNAAFGDCCCDLAVWQLDESARPRELRPREVKTLPLAELQRFSGVYAYQPQVFMRLTSEDDHLRVEVDGARGGSMYPVSGNEFVSRDERVRFAFMDEHGTIVGFVLTQHGIERFVHKQEHA